MKHVVRKVNKEILDPRKANEETNLVGKDREADGQPGYQQILKGKCHHMTDSDGASLGICDLPKYPS